MARVDQRASPALEAWVRALELTAPIARDAWATLPARIDQLAEKYGSSAALVSDHVSLSFHGLSEQSNRYARWAIGQGLAAGDVVCLVMHNCPEYMAIWLGVTHVGAVVSLVNTSLVGDSLAHAINVAAPSHIIAGADLAHAVAAVLPKVQRKIQCWAHGSGAHDFHRIDDAIRDVPGGRLGAAEGRRPTIADPALLIYTSGTTGLPKAARVSHRRLVQWSYWFAGMLGTGPSDRMYNCLPMYHSVGGIVAIGSMLVSGGSTVVRERFSARRFWDEVVGWDCTLFQYIGELCRFLVNTPPHPLEREHRLRLCAGNGLSLGVWQPFQERFRIPRIFEFYAATEANFSLFNCEGKPGAIGRIPPFLGHRFPVTLVQFDVDAGAPKRNGEGRCVRCGTNEAGEAISQIVGDGSSPASQFDGYTDAAASEAKVLRNVFAAGDAWYRSGDLMRRDAEGFFYYVDRVGDTFRWKGENVSTTEVAQQVAACPGVVDVVVYGVTVPGTDGRAGMAALVVSPDFDLDAFHHSLAGRLPEYARPVFLRFLTETEVTGTFKHTKQNLVRMGYDPSLAASDPIYFGDRTRARYVKLDSGVFGQIQSGGLRL